MDVIAVKLLLNTGAEGGVVSVDRVVTLTELLSIEKFPSASLAFTVKEKLVPALKPEAVYEVVVEVPISTPFLNME